MGIVLVVGARLALAGLGVGGRIVDEDKCGDAVVFPPPPPPSTGVGNEIPVVGEAVPGVGVAGICTVGREITPTTEFRRRPPTPPPPVPNASPLTEEAIAPLLLLAGRIEIRDAMAGAGAS